MILMYEDEKYYIQEYIEIIEDAGYEIKVFHNAEEFLHGVRSWYKNIQLFIIDIMVFGPGNEFGGRNTNGGARSGLVLLDEIEKVENESQNITPKKKIIFTNRKGPVFEEAELDKRVTKAIRKSDVLPSEFIKIVREVIQK